MTQQPPDEEPTVAWTPPEEPPSDAEPAAQAPTAPQPTAPDAAIPADAAPPLTPPAPPPSPAADDSTGESGSPDPQSPLISWTPSADATAAATGATGAASAGAGVTQAGAATGWVPPGAGMPASPVEGYHVAGVGTRVVAWFLDVSVLTIVTLVIVVVALIVLGQAFSQNEFAVSALTAILTVGLSFLYFVGPWTGGSGATLGMRSVGVRVVSAAGGTLEIGPAILRWVALGWPAAFVALIPVVGSVASWALTGWTIVLLLTTAMSDTKQGLHDRFAGSAVLRRNGAGSGWAVVGCLLILGALVLLAFLLPLLLLTTLPPEFWEEFQRQLQLEMERQS